jgi:hypothetical protein
MKQEQIRQLLEGLDWSGGLTRQEVMRELQPLAQNTAAADVNLEGLYLALQGGRKFFGAEEALDSIPNTYWEL